MQQTDFFGQKIEPELEAQTCPCCGQVVKLYARKIHRTPARELIRLWHLGPGFHHNREFKKDISAGDFHKLAHWGLVEPKPNLDNPKKRCTGYWRITFKGVLFVKNQLKVARYCYVYNRQVHSFSDEQISIVDALQSRFDYEKLISGRP